MEMARSHRNWLIKLVRWRIIRAPAPSLPSLRPFHVMGIPKCCFYNNTKRILSQPLKLYGSSLGALSYMSYDLTCISILELNHVVQL